VHLIKVKVAFCLEAIESCAHPFSLGLALVQCGSVPKMPATTLLAVQVFLVLTSISITSAFRFYPFRRRQSDSEEEQPVPVSPEAFMSTVKFDFSISR
jgi:hypothetical protein